MRVAAKLICSPLPPAGGAGRHAARTRAAGPVCYLGCRATCVSTSIELHIEAKHSQRRPPPHPPLGLHPLPINFQMPKPGSRCGSGSQDKPHQVLDAVGCQQLDATGTEPHGHGRSRFRPVAHGVGRVAVGRIGVAPVHPGLVAGGPGDARAECGQRALDGCLPLRAKIGWIKEDHVHIGQARHIWNAVVQGMALLHGLAWWRLRPGRGSRFVPV